MEEKNKQKAQELLGKLIKRKRIELNKTQEELGVNVGYSPQGAKQAISQLERGLGWIPTKKQEFFVQFLMLDPAFIQLLFYHYFSRNYVKSLEMLRDLEDKKLRSLSTAINTSSHSPDSAESAISPQLNIDNKLAQLKKLFERGLIDEEEYKSSKKEVLERFLKG